MIGIKATPEGRKRKDPLQVWTWVDVKPGLKIKLCAMDNQAEGVILDKPVIDQKAGKITVNARVSINGSPRDMILDLSEWGVEPRADGTWQNEKWMLFAERPY